MWQQYYVPPAADHDSRCSIFVPEKSLQLRGPLIEGAALGTPILQIQIHHDPMDGGA